MEESSRVLSRSSSPDVWALLYAGKFAEAEQLFLQSLRSIPPTPFHVVCDLEITTSRAETAEYFDKLIETALTQGEGEDEDEDGLEVAAVYAEMNAFAMNPGRWFCDGFAFSFYGGRDSHEWLGDFFASADGSLVIEGLEPLQQVFVDDRMARSRDAREDVRLLNAKRIAEALVIVKFQRLLAEARPLMRRMNVPLVATAHDYYPYLAEIPSNIEPA
jgi:hypothetical protein